MGFMDTCFWGSLIPACPEQIEPVAKGKSDHGSTGAEEPGVTAGEVGQSRGRHDSQGGAQSLRQHLESEVRDRTTKSSICLTVRHAIQDARSRSGHTFLDLSHFRAHFSVHTSQDAYSETLMSGHACICSHSRCSCIVRQAHPPPSVAMGS